MIRITKEPVRCPVSDEIIGYRWIEAEANTYCADCDFTYLYHQYEYVPFANQKGKLKGPMQYCGPDGCICHG